MSELTHIHLVRHGEVDNPSGELYVLDVLCNVDILS